MKDAEAVTFGGNKLDRAAHLRGDLAPLLADPSARAVVMWQGKPLIDLEGGPTIAWVELSSPILKEATAAPIFLGLDGTAPRFGVDVSAWEDPKADREEMAKFLDTSENQHPDAPDRWKFIELRTLMAELGHEDGSIIATARAIQSWHDIHPFCAKCGAKSDVAMGGWQRDCPACGASHFPRTDPVIIALVTHGNSVLMGRSPQWPENFFSLLAGFMEPGETVEAATRREVFEEAGVRLGDVQYLSSQPWPFPSSLMMGMQAEALSTEITIDENEIAEAKWVTREELMAAQAGENPELLPARKGAIARFLIDRWLADSLD